MLDSLADFVLNAFALVVVLGFAAIPVVLAFIVVALSRGWFSLPDCFGGRDKKIR